MTVCLAALFRWNYASTGQPLDVGVAALTVSDRMVTAGDIQYEPQQQKIAQITDHISVLVAGDFDLHSEAIKNVKEQAAKNSSARPFDVAVMYGYQIQAIQRRHAEAIYLAPLGLNTDTFLVQQKDMSERFVDALTSQLQTHHDSEVQAIVVGVEKGHAHIYSVDYRGAVRSFDDVGFVAVGTGAWHAQSVMMQSGYVNTWTLANALMVSYAAKKAAEVAPGVGRNTDVRLFLREGNFVLNGSGHEYWERIASSMEEIFAEYMLQRKALGIASVVKLQDVLNGPQQKTAENVTPITSAPGASGKNTGSGAPTGAKDGSETA